MIKWLSKLWDQFRSQTNCPLISEWLHGDFVIYRAYCQGNSNNIVDAAYNCINMYLKIIFKTNNNTILKIYKKVSNLISMPPIWDIGLLARHNQILKQIIPSSIMMF